MKKVSIVVPVYNSEENLSKCIESILNQTYKNIEVVLIDDGSQDGSLSIIEVYSEKDDRIKYFSQLNKGVSAARNKGMSVSSAEYIYFVDADDFIDVDTISELVSAMHKDQSDIVISGYREININNNKISSIKEIYPNRKIYVSLNSFLKNYSEIYTKRLYSAPWNSLYNLNLIKENNILFDRDLNYGEDTIFNLSYIRYCRIISTLDKSMYNYLKSDTDSLSTSSNENKFEIMKQIYSKNIKLIELEKESFEKNYLVLSNSFIYQSLNYLKSSIKYLNLSELKYLSEKVLFDSEILKSANNEIKIESKQLKLLRFLIRNKKQRLIQNLIILKKILTFY